MKRPPLRAVPLPADLAGSGLLMITMSPGQWDVPLQLAYDAGWTLIEVEDDRPVRAYRQSDPPVKATPE